MGSRKTTTTKQNQTQTNSAASFAQPGLNQTADRVTQALGQIDPTGYQGDFYARPDAGITQNIVGAYANAGQQANNVGGQAQASFDQLNNYDFNLNARDTAGTVGFNYEGPQLNPTQFSANDGEARLNAAIQAGINPVFENLEERLLPQIRSDAIRSGAYGNSRAYATLPTQVIEDASESAQRIGAELAYQGFQQDENRRLSAHTDNESNLLQAYGLGTNRTLGQAGIEANLVSADADRNLAAQTSSANLELQRAGLTPSLADTILRAYSSEGDLFSRARDADIYSRQVDIDNALARDQYEYTRPFAGLDTATSLLTALGATGGTSTSQGSSTTTERSGGLGNVVQGIAGLGGLAASFIPGLGQVAAAAPAVASAAANRDIAPASAAFQNTGFVGPR